MKLIPAASTALLTLGLLLSSLASTHANPGDVEVADIHRQPQFGVHPSKKHLYPATSAKGGSFACLDGEKSIPASAVNDDYCDCADGSDEPGTSACVDGVFYCTNEGHIGASIPSSRVNDGVCDPECCDGSDEYNGSIKCKDKCRLIGAEYKRELEQKRRTLEKGVKLRKEYVAFAEKAGRERRELIRRLEVDLANATSRIEELNCEGSTEYPVVKTQAEAFEAKMNAAKTKKDQASQRELLPQKLEACRKTKSSLRDEIQSLHSRIDKLRDALNHLQSMRDVEEGAAFLALLRDKPILKETLDKYEEYLNEHGTTEFYADIPDDPIDTGDSNESFGSYQDDTSNNSAGSSSSSGGALFEDPCEDPTTTLAACIKATFTQSASQLLHATKAPLRWSGWAKITTSLKNMFTRLSPSEELQLLSKDASKARSKVYEAENTKRDLESKLEDLRKRESTDTGLQKEWEKLWDTCISIDSFEYTYEICFFGKATQKPRKGHGDTDLGKFSRWGDRVGKTGVGKEKYFTFMYENGAHCWNGPARSVEVTVSCDAETKVLSVSEPSKCEYAMKITSPAVCDEDLLKAFGKGHEEL
ncbi:hypothetical protein HDV05_008137 [Chytridiales sp. JEL 0842]|nr:hypothetical protein HDV05_008137 [Chytridiales sp. JEL 0842]